MGIILGRDELHICNYNERCCKADSCPFTVECSTIDDLPIHRYIKTTIADCEPEIWTSVLNQPPIEKGCSHV